MGLSVITGRLVPFYLVHAYRLAPGRLRGSRAWPGSRGPSSSHMALDLMAEHAAMSGWTAIRLALDSNDGHRHCPPLPHWDG